MNHKGIKVLMRNVGTLCEQITRREHMSLESLILVPFRIRLSDGKKVSKKEKMKKKQKKKKKTKTENERE